ncbi:MAG: MBL fold metallo-hydrolase [Candidatus Omnitrophica bacterium]|nr:MBL fold metallo-hydrolase [Candidatus Omnitrophota bacterium]
MAGVGQEGDFIKFLGTAGARFVMIRQLRSSGGIWVRSKSTNVLIDPGPGSISRCALSRPKLDPCSLDGIILTHRHLDHAGDINVMIEAMTEGGFKKRGIVYCPSDVIDEDPLILRHIRRLPEKIRVLRPGKSYAVGDFNFQTSMKHIHPVKTYGLKFRLAGSVVSLVSDTGFFNRLADFYKSDILIVCVAFLAPRPGIDHLSLQDAEVLIRQIRPKKAILTHFGMTMLKAKPHLLAESLSKKLKTEVIAAYDGMKLVL